ncbi:hypothetical protein HY029_01185 [Candidatus Gottesmanbacteria bacterium]|nr:hypothetical protein [Candidatus Gottesmanbacteria bacterium]
MCINTFDKNNLFYHDHTLIENIWHFLGTIIGVAWVIIFLASIVLLIFWTLKLIVHKGDEKERIHLKKNIFRSLIVLLGVVILNAVLRIVLGIIGVDTLCIN